MMPARLRFALAVVPPLGLMLGVACSGSTSGKDPDTPGDGWAGESRDTEIKHEECSTGGKQVKTFKGESALSSNKSFVTRVYESGREICSFADLNGDGNIDVYTFFGDDGRIRRREASYSVSKQIDEIALYKNGNLEVVMRETNFDGKLDTWDYYEGGKLIRRERDKTGDGRIDEWWTFEPGTENATIVQADVHTGKPDPTSTTKLGIGGSSMGGVGAPKPDTGPETNDTGTGLMPSLTPMGAPTTDAATDAPADGKADAAKKDAK
jgi:hypothetical protein